MKAVEFARRVDLPLNTHVTIIFPPGTDEARVAGWIGKTIKAYRQWLGRRIDLAAGTATTHVWVRETATAQASHVHILIHVPIRFQRDVTNQRFARFLPKDAGINWETVSDAARRKSGTPVLVLNAVDDREARRWAKYVVKGSDPATGSEVGVTSSDQGSIVGPRRGIAENIGPVEWAAWLSNFRLRGREFAMKRWVEEASHPKRRPRSVRVKGSPG